VADDLGASDWKFGRLKIGCLGNFGIANRNNLFPCTEFYPNGDHFQQKNRDQDFPKTLCSEMNDQSSDEKTKTQSIA